MIRISAEGGKGSRRHIMNSRGRRWTASEKGAGNRGHGISVITNGSRSKSDGYGGLFVFRNRGNLPRTLPAIVYRRSNPEDIDDSCEQHAADALRYGTHPQAAFFAETKVSRDLSTDPFRRNRGLDDVLTECRKFLDPMGELGNNFVRAAHGSRRSVETPRTVSVSSSANDGVQARNCWNPGGFYGRFWAQMCNHYVVPRVAVLMTKDNEMFWNRVVGIRRL